MEVRVVMIFLVEFYGQFGQDVPVLFLPVLVPVVSRNTELGVDRRAPRERAYVRLLAEVELAARNIDSRGDSLRPLHTVCKYGGSDEE